ncbi:MAG: YidC/Oxa1 family membrane protein insertase [Gallionella sp.]
MLSSLLVIFAPFIFLIENGYHLYWSLTGSAGLAILLTSATFSIAVFPLQRWSKRFENKIALRLKTATEEISKLDKSLKGEARFNEIEKIYVKSKYHPIQSIALGLSFYVTIPFLIASLLLFNQSDILAGAKFLFIDDLKMPDGTLSLGTISINILPLMLFIFTFIDAVIRYKDNPSIMHRFMFVSVVLTFLIYSMPAGLLLYWIGANLMSFTIYWISTSLAAR